MNEDADTGATGSSEPQKQERRVDPKLLEILVCPVTRTSLEYDRERQELVSRAARLAFPIREGIPILLEEEARPLKD
ncbi:Trm112 family protein [Afifella pfennigii]|uniref:Trm112 family protein n=1 Tax=Afifella pfennigii TaxID=209897 RepID=UPI000A0187F7|nr:Trm112 family protein [Afifella pfennigii]